MFVQLGVKGHTLLQMPYKLFRDCHTLNKELLGYWRSKVILLPPENCVSDYKKKLPGLMSLLL